MLDISPDKRRKVTAAARLLLSDKPGEVVGAVHAIGRMLPAGITVPDLIERSVTAPAPAAMPRAAGYPFGSWQQRARMAIICPHLTDWERDFLRSIVQRSKLVGRQETVLHDILRKAEGEPL